MPTMRDDDDADTDRQLQAVEAGILATLHDLSRRIATLQRTHGPSVEALQLEWAATDLATLAVLRAELVLSMARRKS